MSDDQRGDEILVLVGHHAHCLCLLEDCPDVLVVAVNNNLPPTGVLHLPQHSPATR